MFLPNMIQAALFPESLTAQQRSQKVIRQNYGPGQIDGWNWLEGEENCFIQTSVTQQTSAKRKIICSFTHLAHSPPNDAELAFFSTLIDSQEYEVYLWPGSQTRFSTCVPMKSSDEFWANRESIPQDSVDEIKNSLTLQAIALNSCFIIHEHNLKKILDTISYQWQLLKDTCVGSQSYAIPKMTYTEMWDNKKDLYTPSQREEVLILNIQTDYEVLDLSAYKNLKTLSINKSFCLKKVILPEPNTIESLTLAECHSIENINALIGPELKHLNINNCHNSHTVNYSLINGLETLRIQYLKTQQLRLGTNNKLRKLVLRNLNNLQELSLGDNPVLEYININEVQGNIPRLVLKKLPKLKTLMLGDINSSVKLELVDLPDLRIVTTQQMEVELHLHAAPQLHSLTMEDDEQTISLVAVQDCPKLSALTIKAEHILYNWSALEFPPTCQLQLFDLAQGRELKKQSTHYLKSPVDIFSLEHPLQVDTNIKMSHSSTPVKVAGECKVTLNSTEDPGKRAYRTQVLDHISLSDDGSKILFENQPQMENLIRVSSHTTLLDKENLPTANRGISSGYYEIQTLHPQRFYPLTTMTSQPIPYQLGLNFMIYSYPEHAVSVYWDQEKQQGYIKANTGFANKPVDILYQYKEHASYNDLSNKNPHVWHQKLNPRPLLPPELKSRVTQHITNIPKLKFLADKTLGSRDKLSFLSAYCRGLNLEIEIKTNKDERDMDKLLKLIHSLGCLGACMQRSQVFMILARLIDVPVRIASNGTHAYAEVPFQVNNSIQWYRYDLGGTNRIYSAPQDIYINPFTRVLSRQHPPSAAAKTIMPASSPVSTHENTLDVARSSMNEPTFEDELKKNKATTRKLQQQRLFAESQAKAEKLAQTKEWYTKKYQNAFAKILQQHEISSIEELFTHSFHLTPLITPPKGIDIHQLKEVLIKHSQKQSKPAYLYIHDAADFKKYFKPTVLQQGERKTIAGPLCELIKHGGTLLVNWSNFSAKDLVFFKSILDEEPTLFDESLPKKLKVLGLNQSGVHACSAFASRCQPVTLSADCLNNTPKKNEIPIEPILIELDLCHRLDWKDILFGKIKFSGATRSVTEGFLERTLKTYKNNLCFVFNNPPNDPVFSKLVTQIRDEGRFYHNGVFISLPSNVTIETQEKTNNLMLNNISISLSLPESITRYDCIDIGAYNWHECFEQVVIDQAKKATSHLGYLHQYRYFYVSGFISASQWQTMQDYLIKNALTNEPYQFILAPGAEIESVLGHPRNVMPTQIRAAEMNPHQHSIMVSNDPDYLSQQLARENDLIIDVHPQMGIHDLLVKLTITQNQKNAAQVHFNQEEMSVLKALRTGRNVILNGELSLTVYNQLLPLLDEPRQLRLNGEHLTAEQLGKLKLVLPPSALKNLSLTTYAQCEFSAEDYKKAFPKQQEQVVAIQHLYQLAKAMPHHGQGMPQKPVLTHAHLNHLLHALNHSRGVHPHNPLKGLFLYDYPRYSEQYAYLNVLSKQLFSAEDVTPLRMAKLQKILKNQQVNHAAEFKNTIWRVLNCFSGKALNELLGQVTHAFTLPPELSAHLGQTIQSAVQAPVEEQPKYHLKKRQTQLERLLEDANTRLIFIKGEPGVGKTHTIKALNQAYPLYEGEKNIGRWLLDESEQCKILLLDEANLMQPGTWDFLKGLERKTTTISYKGKEYIRKDNHKVIATGNPENFPNRSYHELFQQYAETLYFKLPDDHELQETILNPILKKELAHFSAPLLKVFHLIGECNPLHDYSQRDLKSVAERLVHVLQTKKQNEEATQLFLQTCITEFASSMQNKANRDHFIARLHHLFPQIPVVKAHPASFFELKHRDTLLSLPQEKSYVVDKIVQDLHLSRNAIRSGRYYKQGILLEGAAGAGKSTLYKALLEMNDYLNGEKLTVAEKNQARPNYYYQINVGDKSAPTRLEQAFHEGAVVILEELNLDDSLEALLNQLLEGRDSHGQTAANPGFLVLGSQNPGFLEGRGIISQALRNRVDMIYMDSYSQEELITIASRNKIPCPELFVAAYVQQQQKNPDTVNMRTFFTALRAETGSCSASAVHPPALNVHPRM